MKSCRVGTSISNLPSPFHAIVNGLTEQHGESMDGDEHNPHQIWPPSSNGLATRYVVWPKDGNDADAVARTEDFLKQLTQQPRIVSHDDQNGAKVGWVANVDDIQADVIKNEKG